MSTYLEIFDGPKSLMDAFKIDEQDLAPYETLLAWYEYENYSGDAFVLLQNKTDGSLFEVNGSHCSCYGLEDQWCPEETSKAALLHRMEQGGLGTDGYYKKDKFAKRLKQILTEVSDET